MSITTTPTGLDLRTAVANGDMTLAEAVLVLDPSRGKYADPVFPWEVACGHAEPAEDCRVVTGKHCHGLDWCYACWMADHDRRKGS